MSEVIHNFFLVDDEPNSFPVLTVKNILANNGHVLVGEATSRGETISKIEELTSQSVIATLAIIDGFSGRGSEIAELLHAAWPDIKTLGFSMTPQGGWCNRWLPKMDSRMVLDYLKNL